ncbi:MAG: metallophosphoesterase, partial [Polyangiaceae bacterium]
MISVKHAAGALALFVLGFSCAGPGAPNASDQSAATVVTPSARATIAIADAAPPQVAAGNHGLGTCENRGKTAKFWFAHFNDLQARYDESVDGKNRYGLIAGALRTFKKDAPETLVLDAGDDYEKGALTELRSMGESTRQMIQALPIDIRTIGNHDFAYGEDAVVRDVLLSAHPVLAANIRYDANPRLFQPYSRFDVGCVKVGVVGVVTRGYGADDQPIADPFAGVFVQNDDYEKIVAREVEAHRSEVDVMIALTHLGIGVDMMLAARIPGIDFVIGGHTEDTLEHPGWVMRVNGTRGWVLQAGHYGRAIGHGSVTVDFGTHAVVIDSYKLVPVDASLPYAADVGQLATRLERETAPDSQRPIAVASAEIPQGKALADLVWRAVADRWGADAMILGKDLFWDKLHAG